MERRQTTNISSDIRCTRDMVEINTSRVGRLPNIICGEIMLFATLMEWNVFSFKVKKGAAAASDYSRPKYERTLTDQSWTESATFFPYLFPPHADIDSEGGGYAMEVGANKIIFKLFTVQNISVSNDDKCRDETMMWWW